VSITTIFFDLYQTVAYLHPERELRQQLVLKEFGFDTELNAVRRAYLAADLDYTLVGLETPLYLMSREQRHPIYIRFQQQLMRSLGLDDSAPLAEQLYQRYWELERKLRLYPDVVPALTRLREMGYRIGLITNVTDDPSKDVERIGLMEHLDALIASCVERCDKPNPRIFQAALERLGAAPAEAVHVGDQLLADAQGATRVGIQGILLDRYDLQAGDWDLRVRSLLELPALLRNGATP